MVKLMVEAYYSNICISCYTKLKFSCNTLTFNTVWILLIAIEEDWIQFPRRLYESCCYLWTPELRDSLHSLSSTSRFYWWDSNLDSEVASPERRCLGRFSTLWLSLTCVPEYCHLVRLMVSSAFPSQPLVEASTFQVSPCPLYFHVLILCSRKARVLTIMAV